MTYRFNVITIKFPARTFVDIHKGDLKFIWKGHRTRIAKKTMKKHKGRSVVLPDLRYYIVTGRHTDQWKRLESLEIIKPLGSRTRQRALGLNTQKHLLIN